MSEDASGATLPQAAACTPGFSDGSVASADFSLDGGFQDADLPGGDMSGADGPGGDCSADASQDDSSMYDDQSMPEDA